MDGSAVVSVGPAWWQTLLIAVGGGLLTLIGTLIVGWFSRETSRHAEWFRRVQWAQGMTTATDERTQAAGYRVLAYLSDSTLASHDDQLLLEQLAMDPDLDALSGANSVAVDQTDYVLDNGSGDERGARQMDDSTKSSSESANSTSGKSERRIQRVTPSMVASARAQVTIAGKLGKKVPPAIEKIAKVGTTSSR